MYSQLVPEGKYSDSRWRRSLERLSKESLYEKGKNLVGLYELEIKLSR